MVSKELILLNGAPSSGKSDRNTDGWNSIAGKWSGVGWPRRPRWDGEFERIKPVLDSMTGKEALVMGATPEFRAWLNSKRAEVTLYEKSPISLEAMTAIMRRQLCVLAHQERVIQDDWESNDYERGRYMLVMGDIALGYLETKGRLHAFLVKLHDMLKSGGHAVFREFVREPYTERAYGHLPVDARRWAHVLTEGTAIDGDKFYESALAEKLASLGDNDVLATCADPPRTRLILTLKELQDEISKLPFEQEIVVSPSAKDVRLALLLLKKP
ncbi:MAG: hypothetical protein ACP5NX_03805 [Candidatus Bilamarchaeaceae archaeon]